MNKKIILSFFIILGIFALSKNVYADYEDVELYETEDINTEKTIEIKENEVKNITIEEIVNDIIQQYPAYAHFELKNIRHSGNDNDHNNTGIGNDIIAKISPTNEYVRIQGSSKGTTTLTITIAFKELQVFVGYINAVTGREEAQRRITWHYVNAKYNVVVKEGTVRTEINEIDGKERNTNAPFSDVLDNIDNYKPIDEDPDGKVEEKVSIILTVITNIGMILAVLMLAIIGVKYMLGSLEERAEYKKDMIPYLIGAFLLFGITTIVKVLQQLGESINNT